MGGLMPKFRCAIPGLFALVVVASAVVTCKPADQSTIRRGTAPETAPATATSKCDSDPNLSAAEKKACQEATVREDLTGVEDKTKVDFIGGGGAEQYALVNQAAKPFASEFPEVTERFFIASDNSIYYDFMRADGKWDFEENAQRIQDGEITVPEFTSDSDFETPNIINVLFPSRWGILQMQPTRLTDGRVAVFFIDKDKNLKVIVQLSPRSGIFQSVDTAVEIDTHIELIFPLINAQNKIDIVYIKNKDSQQAAFFRTVENEANLAQGFSQVNIYRQFTAVSSIGPLLKKSGEDMKKRKVMLISAKAGDLANANAVLAGKAQGEAGAPPAAGGGEADLALTEIAGGYKAGKLKSAATREGSFGKTISTKEGWSTPSGVCANIATIASIVPVASAGPIGMVMNLGMFSGLQRPEDLQRTQEIAQVGAAGQDLSIENWLAARSEDATNSLMSIRDGTVWSNLSPDVTIVPSTATTPSTPDAVFSNRVFTNFCASLPTAAVGTSEPELADFTKAKAGCDFKTQAATKGLSIKINSSANESYRDKLTALKQSVPTLIDATHKTSLSASETELLRSHAVAVLSAVASGLATEILGKDANAITNLCNAWRDKTPKTGGEADLCDRWLKLGTSAKIVSYKLKMLVPDYLAYRTKLETITAVTTAESGTLTLDQRVPFKEIAQDSIKLVASGLSKDPFWQPINYVELTDEQIEKVNTACTAIAAGVKNGTIQADSDTASAVEFCTDFAILANIRANKDKNMLAADEAAIQATVAPLAFKMAFADHQAFTAALTKMGTISVDAAALKNNVLPMLKIAIPALGVLLLPGITIPALLVYGTFRGINFLYYNGPLYKARIWTPGLTHSTAKLTESLGRVDSAIRDQLRTAYPGEVIGEELADDALMAKKTALFSDRGKTPQIQTSPDTTARNMTTEEFEQFRKSMDVSTKTRTLNQYIATDRELADILTKQGLAEQKLAAVQKEIAAQGEKASEALKAKKAHYEDKIKRFGNQQKPLDELRSKLAAATGSDGKTLLTDEDIKFNKSATRKKLSAWKIRLTSWIGSIPGRAWKGLLNVPNRVVTAIKELPAQLKKNYSNNWRTTEGLAKQGAMLGVAVVAGTLATYGTPDEKKSQIDKIDKLKASGEGGVNTIIESPISALEGLNGIHSTAGALCRGDLGKVFKNTANMGAMMVKGVGTIINGALRMACDGVKALADVSQATGIGTAVSWTACAAKDAVAWVTDKANVVADFTNETIAPGIGTGINAVKDVIKSIWLVDPNSKQVVGTVSGEEAAAASFRLTSPGTVYCIDNPQKVEHPRCYKENPAITPADQLTPVEVK